MICELANWMDKCLSIVLSEDPEPTSEISLINFGVYCTAFVLLVCILGVPILLGRGLKKGLSALIRGLWRPINRSGVLERKFYCKRMMKEAEEKEEGL